MKKVQTVWISPTLCGCVLQRTDEFRVSQIAVHKCAAAHPGDPAMVTLWVKHLEDAGAYDEIVTSYPIVRQCAAHANSPDADSLANELPQFGQNVHRPDTYDGSLTYYFDRRHPPEAREHIPSTTLSTRGDASTTPTTARRTSLTLPCSRSSEPKTRPSTS
jgi:hypothetical protein